MKSNILITGYESPDIDAVASAFAYAEFLNKNGINAIPASFGKPLPEAQFVLKKIKAKLKNGEKHIDTSTQVILVDASDITGISKKIKLHQVVEIIDHRKVHEAEKFRNAKKQIELVGSAATLIGEKFYKGNVDMSKESATLLYSAIVSNTINFHASVTTPRDVTIAQWLKRKTNIDKKYTHEMFSYKSAFRKSLKQSIVDEIAYFTFGKFKVIIAQLEVIDAKNKITKNSEKIIGILNSIKKEKNADFIFLTCIDVEKFYNLFITSDEKTQELLKSIFRVKFENNVAKYKKLLMRKEIAPKIKAILKDDYLIA